MKEKDCTLKVYEESQPRKQNEGQSIKEWFNRTIKNYLDKFTCFGVNGSLAQKGTIHILVLHSY